MREIEFRCKIKGDAGVYFVWAIDWLNQKALVERSCGKEWVSFNKIQAFMQYTGLHDKNGVEIYEGDIISYPAWVRPKGSRKQTLATVVWHLGGFAGKVKGSVFIHELSRTWDEARVLGNIYESPHLLSGSEECQKA